MSTTHVQSLPNVRGRMSYTEFGEGKRRREHLENGTDRIAAQMGDGNVAILPRPVHADGLVHGAYPYGAGRTAQDALAVKPEGGISQLVKGGVVAQKICVNAARSLFQFCKFLPVVFGE